MTLSSSDPASAAGASAENASPNAASEQVNETQNTEQKNEVPVIAAQEQTPPAYVPNYKYKAALQEKELDPFFHPLVKDPESEKKVKEIFSKIDAFDFVKGKKEALEQQYQSIAQDYEAQTQIVQRFNESVKNNDLSSAFRLAGITKDQIFKWTQQQINLMEMPPEQRAQYEQFEQQKEQEYGLKQQVSQLQQQYEQQAVQARTMQLEMALSRPEVSNFAQSWDRNAGQEGAFRDFVIDEAKKVFYTQGQDISPDQAVQMVMQRFGKFLNVGDTTGQPLQVVHQQNQNTPKPVIPNVTGKAAAPIKKVARSIDDLKKIAREMRD
jgi:hypothetical protein